MSDENGSPDRKGLPAGGAGPQPESLRFFGTTWVNHDDGYTLRRVGVAAGSLVVTVGACLVLRFAYEGLAIAEVGRFVMVLLVVMFAGCTALAFGHTWDSFRKRPDPARQASLRGLLAIGFLGALLAYTFRSFREAPGEGLCREEYEAACERDARRSRRRTGNPARRKGRG
ncbi:EamA/RhaT family transporter [Streptomyces roseirectus]|uniref:EamA/RhaT family transporter n=1 Tax=Streptomyces roseirectus TaxID=2768066 RepID=A0A7H0IDX3_9ACTN|nr:EamA/RhaT family transporter [Streptomyces roseirectus]QNP70989.1 EamA/RhaT family transporter [Streptomyces roseirectus]